MDAMTSARAITNNAKLLRGKHFIVGYIPEKKTLIFVHSATGLMVVVNDEKFSHSRYENTTVSNLLLTANILFEVKVSRIYTVINSRGDFISLNKIHILGTVQPLDSPVRIVNEITGTKMLSSDNNELRKSVFITKNLIPDWMPSWVTVPAMTMIIVGCCLDKLNSGELPLYMLGNDQKIIVCKTGNYFSQILDTLITGNISFLEALVRDDTVVKAHWDRTNITLEVVNNFVMKK